MAEEAEGSPVDWTSYNKEFYSASPVSYFMARWNGLMLQAAKPEELGALLVAGIEYMGLTAGIEDKPTTPEDERQHLAFLITESKSLLHHVGECLLRLFLAHAGFPDCPPMEVAALRVPGDFKKQVEALKSTAWPEGLADEVLPVFFGTRNDNGNEQLIEGRKAATRLLRILAELHLDDAPLYNAMKHGLAVMPGEAQFSMADEQTGQGIGFSGTSVGFIHYDMEAGDRIWKHSRRWVSVRRSLWLAHLAITQVDALWTVARTEYAGIARKGTTFVTNHGIDTAMTGAFNDSVGIRNFTHTIGVEPKKPKTPKATKVPPPPMRTR